MEPTFKEKLPIPLAIVVAGGLIAAALFFTRGATTDGSAQTASTQSSLTKEFTLAPISAEDHILGSPRADVTIVEFSDTECPFCKEFHKTMHRIIDTYGRDGSVAWVYRHFPIEQLHKRAPKEAEATECAAEQGGNDMFWRYTDKVYERTGSNDTLDPAELPKIASELGLDVQSFENCLSTGKYKAVVQADYDDAMASLGRGTPHNILVSSKKFSDDTIELIRSASAQLPPQTLTLSPDEKKLVMSGALPYDLVKLLIDSVLGSNS